ncbi:MAG: c-type cytochrome domain-containing protein [Spirosomataceae bacterium]
MLTHFIEFIGRFHPLVVHLPIGILLLAFVFEWLARQPAYHHLTSAIEEAYFWAMLTAIVSCVAGYLLSLSGGYDEDALSLHKWMGIVLTGVAGFLWVGKKFSLPTVFQQISIAAAGILLAFTGHLGGTLTHGDGYLSQPLAAAFDGDAGPLQERKPLANVQEAQVYQEVIAPILSEKCVQCHNQKKQKGDLRLDSPEHIQKGGENGPILVAGKPAESHLYEYLTLPEGNDKHMPPKGKPQPTPQDIALIQWWIQNGAPFDKKVSQLPQDDAIKPVLTSLASGSAGQAANGTPDVPTATVSAADAGAIAALRQLNVLVMPVATESNYLMANMVNTPQFGDAQAAQLPALSKQLVWLRLGNTQITDAGLKEIGKLSNLTRLSLEHTSIGDAGLSALSGLSQLQYLNLFDTQVTDKGLQVLSKLNNLHTVYVYQTKVTPQGVLSLQKALPQVRIDTGGYQKQLLAISDTLKPEASHKPDEKKGKK